MCYAVFDGHNGFHTSQFLADTFTSTLSDRLQAAENTQQTADTRQQTTDTLPTTPRYRRHACTRIIGNTGSYATASQALSTTAAADVLTGCFTHSQEQVLAQKIGGGSTALAFWVTQVDDSDKENAPHPRYVGLCANAGDSRCVLSVGGIARRLSVDHTADEKEEVQRVEGLGGNIDFGMLADKVAPPPL
jgi:serine/threonine protein phosphatase PrpC